MSAHSKVIWTEGLFLRPQHFQQQDRYFERYVEGRCQAIAPHSWGFTELILERDLLAIGKLALRRAAGVFPDGTPFRMPDDCPLPAPLDVPDTVKGETAFLAVPVRRAGAPEGAPLASGDPLRRHDVHELEAADVTSGTNETALLEVGAIRTRILTASDATGAYACLPLAHIVERRVDRQVVLEEAFIPTVLRVRAADRLVTLLRELVGLLHHRGDALSSRVAATSRSATAELADFLRLQLINRLEPVVAHLAADGELHPEAVYRLCLGAAGELATFTSTTRRPAPLPPYRHERLHESFEPLMRVLRGALGAVIEESAVPLPVTPGAYGMHSAVVHDRSLFASSAFVLAARASVPAEDLRQRFPAQLKVGPAEKVRELVRLQLPGVPVHPLPVAPPALPFHAGFVYFELDQQHPLWSALIDSGGVGLHVSGDFPGLDLELWAIRSRREGRDGGR